jgi:hypothetical protein
LELSDDYKYDMQVMAEELAEERFGRDFYSLSDEMQYAIYREAQGNYTDRLADRADFLRKSEREGR